MTDDPYAAKNMIERLGGTVQASGRGRHRLRKPLRPSDEDVQLQQTVRRAETHVAAAQ